MEKSLEKFPQVETSLNLDSSVQVLSTQTEEYVGLQKRYIQATLIVSAIAVTITVFFFDFLVATSLLVGSLFGVLYLWLLARSVGRLGKVSNKVGKIQLLVPVVLVLSASRLSYIEFFPAILGFLIYKPSMILQVFIDSKT